MKAILFKGYGKLETSIFQKDIPAPIPKDNEVLIQIVAASVNPVDYKVVKGSIRLLHRFKLPHPLGYDLSGVIVGVGREVTEFKTGDEVYGRAGDFHPGTFAEYIAMETKYLTYKPSNFSHEEASCIPLVGQTSVQVITGIGKAKAGQKILIHAGSGGIGVFAIQYAKYLNLYVAATTGTANVEWVKSLGADEVIDYKKQNYRDILKNYDIVYDTLGGQSKIDSMKVLKEGGKLISIVGPPDREFAIRKRLNILLKTILTLLNLKVKWLAKKNKVSYNYWLMESDGMLLSEITKIIEEGKIKVYIDKTFSLDRALEALQYVEAGRTKGKVLIKMN